MKILYLGSSHFADCDFPLVKALQDMGYDVTYLILLTPNSKRTTLFDIKTIIHQNNIIKATDYSELQVYTSYMDMTKVYIVNRSCKKESSWAAFHLMVKIARMIKKEKFDIIHTDVIFKMHNAFLYLLFSRWILTVHDPFPHTGEDSFKVRFFRKLAFKKAKSFVLLNSTQKHHFCKTFNINERKVLVNSLGVYDSIRLFLRREISCPAKICEENNVLFFGRISPYKGVDYLCRAMLKVRDVIPNATLTIAGGGMLYFDINPYLEKGIVEVKNHYIGMEELACLLTKCTVVVCPYTDATQSGVVMTAFSLYKPVIATRTGGLAEQIDNGKTGFIVPPKDANALADEIIKILREEKIRNQLKNNIKKKFEKGEQNWRHIAEKYIDFYQKQCIL